MNTLRDYVNWGLTHCDKTADAEGVPLVLENCVRNKKMKQLEVYGNSVQNGTPTPEAPVEVESVGELVTDINDTNYGKYKIPVTVRGENMIPYSVALANNYSEYSVSGTSYTIRGNVGTQQYDAKAGQLMFPSLSSIETYGIEVKAGKTYRITFDYLLKEQGVYNEYIALLVYGTSNVVRSQYLSIGGNVGKTISFSRSFTSQYDEKVCVCFRINNNLVTLSNIRFEDADVEPITTNVYLNEPLRKIGDYADVIDFRGKKVVRNTLKRIYDGVSDANNPLNMVDNETYWKVVDDLGDLGDFWRCTLYDSLPVIPKNVYADFTQIPKCLQLPVKTGKFIDASSPATVDKELIWYSSDGRNVNLFLSKDRFDGTVTGLCAYLKANPITVYCAIYEPYEEPITCELPTLPAKTSIVEVDTSLLPSNIKGKYIKR